MKKDYAAMMGGYGTQPIKKDTGTDKKSDAPNRSDVKVKTWGIIDAYN